MLRWCCDVIQRKCILTAVSIYPSVTLFTSFVGRDIYGKVTVLLRRKRSGSVAAVFCVPAVALKKLRRQRGQGRGGEGGSYGSNDKCSGWVFHLSLVYTSSNYICFHQDIVKIKAVQWNFKPVVHIFIHLVIIANAWGIVLIQNMIHFDILKQFSYIWKQEEVKKFAVTPTKPAREMKDELLNIEEGCLHFGVITMKFTALKAAYLNPFSWKPRGTSPPKESRNL